MASPEIIDTTEAGLRLGVSADRVLQFIRAGRLPADRLGRRVYRIRASDLRRVARRRTGRPPKSLKTRKI